MAVGVNGPISFFTENSVQFNYEALNMARASCMLSSASITGVSLGVDGLPLSS